MKVKHFAAGSGETLASAIEEFLGDRSITLISLSYTAPYPHWPPKDSEGVCDDYAGCERALLIYAEPPLLDRWTQSSGKAHLAA